MIFPFDFEFGNATLGFNRKILVTSSEFRNSHLFVISFDVKTEFTSQMKMFSCNMSCIHNK